MTVTCGPNKFLSEVDFQQSLKASANAEAGQIQHHLVLDLDHTLISSFEFGESPATRENTVSPILVGDYVDEYGMPQMYHATISNVVVLIKLRPFVRSFIKSVSRLGLTLHIYTKGRRAYMNEVIRLIDPDGVITGRRVSRDDEPITIPDGSKDPSLVLSTFPSDPASIIVLDDSPSVWASWAHALEVIAARRYTFGDKFVAYLRSMERMSRPGVYPKDLDDYLQGLTGSVIRTALERALRRTPLALAPVVADEEEEEATFTPINVWDEEDKPVAVERAASDTVITVSRRRLV